MGKVSIRDVASLAGVSIATVSQVLNGKGGRFSEKTKVKVLAARDEIGYVPNASARSLKQGANMLIGVVVPSLQIQFFGNIVQKMQEHLPENTSLSIMTADRGAADQAVETLVNSGVHGIIVVSQLTQPVAIAQSLKRRGVALVVLENHDELSDADAVYASDKIGGRLVAQHLISLGHKHVVLLGNQLYTDNLLYRTASFKETMLAAGAKVSEVTTRNLTKHAGRAAAMAVSITQATAAFALNDELAVGLISGLNAHGIRVPEDISVVGYDDTDYAEFFTPALTTVQQPVELVVKAAIKTVIERIKQPDMTRQVTAFDTTLVIRSSTAPLK
ncbi:MAG: LacI family DNA-binding transcriptional regulator [Weissella hellenica]|uniref:LacI family DNA-binding transcriptional regulator n=1 Tax=Weissella hellenica TaxID=46256 RepID=UPI00388428AF